ncbi:MAG: hypothetical protein ACOCQD_04085 [archaeon]
MSENNNPNKNMIYDYIDRTIDLKIENLNTIINNLKERIEKISNVKDDINIVQLWIEGTKKDILTLSNELRKLKNIIRDGNGRESLIQSVHKLTEKTESIENELEVIKQERLQNQKILRTAVVSFISSIIILILTTIINTIFG